MGIGWGTLSPSTHVTGLPTYQELIPRRQKDSLNSCPASLAVKRGPISLLIANSRSTFDSAAHFYGGETTNLTLRAAIPADSLVYLGPDLVLAWFTFKGIFSECLIPSTIDTSKHDKAPVGLCVRHKRLLAPEEHGATVSNFTEDLRPTTGVG